MKITDLVIDRFGVWRDLELPLSNTGVSVVYGPNEAGKSTLMRFIRSVLYGYRSQDERTSGPQGKPVACSGALRIAHRGQPYEIRRTSEPGTRGRLLVSGTGDADATARIQEFVGGTSESLFENVFAIGLQELQELATLNADDVARHIYGISLGPDGERILQAQATIDRERQQLLQHDQRAGELVDLAKQLAALDKEMSTAGDMSQRHADLTGQRDRLAADITRQKQRQVDLERELRGHQFLNRVWGPWSRLRNLRAEVHAMPSFTHFPSDALENLDDLDRQLDDLTERRRRLLDEARQLHEQAEALAGQPQLEDCGCALRSLSEQQEALRGLERALPDRQLHLQRLQQQIDERLQPLSERWAAGQLESVDASPASFSRLWEKAHRYRQALARRKRTIQRYKRSAAQTQRRQSLLGAQLKTLDGGSIAQAQLHAHQRLAELEDLSRLRQRETVLEHSSAALKEQLREASNPRDLPPFFYGVLWFFGLAGVVLFGVGLFGLINGLLADGVQHVAWVAGLILFLLGLCCGGVTWTMKEHFEPRRLNLDGLRQRLNDIDAELRETHRAIDRIVNSDSARGSDFSAALPQPEPVLLRPEPRSPLRSDAALAIHGAPAKAEGLTETDLIVLVRRRLADLDELARNDLRHRAVRKHLSRMRQALHDCQQDVTAARRDWCDLLRQLGFQETVQVRQALDDWHRVVEARSLWETRRTADRELHRDRQAVDDFRDRMQQIARRIDGPQARVADVYVALADWIRQLDALERNRIERLRLRQAARQKRRQAEEVDTLLGRFRSQRTKLLAQAGAANREELVARLKAYVRYQEIQREMADCQRKLEEAARTEPDLAVVEEDLAAYDGRHNEHSVETIRKELAGLQSDLQSAHERMGRVKQEIRDLENDRRLTSLRFDREQLAAELQQATEKWCALQLADEAMEEIRSRVERTGQPHSLKHASNYLSRLTLGKYHNIWTPLGQRHLVVDDDQAQSLRVEQLSSGTREQLFLAVRLAMIRNFADHGVELPMILDDVVVNFDQARTEAAVSTLLDFADDGQQILLFTCHLHLAHLFESKGIEPIWLPSHTAVEDRRAS